MTCNKCKDLEKEVRVSVKYRDSNIKVKLCIDCAYELFIECKDNVGMLSVTVN